MAANPLHSPAHFALLDVERNYNNSLGGFDRHSVFIRSEINLAAVLISLKKETK